MKVKVTVFGANGRTGRAVVTTAVARGHAVKAVARRAPSPPLDAAATTAIIDTADATAMASVLSGTEAVISAMGPAGDRPGTAYSDAVGALVRAMESSAVRRLVIAANARVLDDRQLNGPYAEVSLEHRRAFETVRGSALDWTVMATPMLSDAEPRHEYRSTVDQRGEGREIARADYSIALVDALDRDEWIGHIVDVTD